MGLGFSGPMPLGIRKCPKALVTITVAATTTLLYTLSTGRASTAVIKKLLLTNRNAAISYLDIGETVGVTWTPRLPRLQLLSNIPMILGAEDIPEFIFTSNIQARATAINVEVMIEVEERSA